MNGFTIDLGVSVQDKITGFKGRTTGRVQYITGCNQYTVQPDVKKDGDFIEARWFDEHRLDVLSNVPLVLTTDESLPASRRDGADIPAPIK